MTKTYSVAMNQFCLDKSKKRDCSLAFFDGIIHMSIRVADVLYQDKIIT